MGDGNRRCHPAPLLERNDIVVTTMRDECWHSNRGQQRTHFDHVTGALDATCVIGRGGCTLKIGEPANLLLRSVRQKKRGEGPHERRVFVAPALSQHGYERVALIAFATCIAALRITPMDDE